MHFVVDPNVLISGAISTGPSARLVDLWLTQRPFELVACPALLAELEEVLMRPKFRRWLDVNVAQAFVQRIRDEAVLRDDPEVLPGVTPDPDDDYLVALAREAKADYLISGDTDLCCLTDPKPPVLTPAGALALLESRTSACGARPRPSYTAPT